MTRTAGRVGLAAWLLLSASAAYGQTVVPVQPAQTGAVYIAKEAVATALAGRPTGVGLASLAAVRAGDDRVNVDVLKRVDAAAEGPVSHDLVTEIYYILDGGGVMETGGSIVDPGPMLAPGGGPVNLANIGPSKRGTKMVGGTTHHVGVGDVVMIPPGVVHRFKSLDGSVTYIAVRVNPGFEKGR